MGSTMLWAFITLIIFIVILALPKIPNWMTFLCMAPVVVFSGVMSSSDVYGVLNSSGLHLMIIICMFSGRGGRVLKDPPAPAGRRLLKRGNEHYAQTKIDGLLWKILWINSAFWMHALLQLLAVTHLMCNGLFVTKSNLKEKYHESHQKL